MEKKSEHAEKPNNQPAPAIILVGAQLGENIGTGGARHVEFRPH
jgi:hypothetical protein